MITLRGLRPSKAGKPADRPEPRAASYEGGLQGVGNGHALGWCWKPADPDARVKVAIAVDGDIVAEGPADVVRPDLAEYGDGAHGFLIALPESLQAPGRRRVLALAGAEKVPIAAAPSFWHKAGSGNGWSDVVFEPDQTLSSGGLPAKVPAPPVSPDPRAVVLDGWLFDAREFEPSITGRTPAELDATVTALSAAAAACGAVGISYVPVVVPDKRHVVGGAAALDRSWLEALGARLRDVDEVDLLDLLPVLRDAARHGSPYHRTDADWNDRGAFFVARALLKDAHKRVPALRPLALADLHLRPVPSYRGTLADAPKLEPVGNDLVPCEPHIEAEEGVVIDAHGLHALRMPVEPHLAQSGSAHLRVYANPAQDADARVAVVGDSASLPLVLWLSERTRRTTFSWSQALPLDQLELELPPLVLHLMRERDLLGLGSSPPDRARS